MRLLDISLSMSPIIIRAGVVEGIASGLIVLHAPGGSLLGAFISISPTLTLSNQIARTIWIPPDTLTLLDTPNNLVNEKLNMTNMTILKALRLIRTIVNNIINHTPSQDPGRLQKVAIEIQAILIRENINENGL